MASLKLDLPQDTLNEVSHLAQQLNVHRADILVQAVARFAQLLAVNQELSLVRDQLAEAGRSGKIFAQDLQRQRPTTIQPTQELENVRRQATDAIQAKSQLQKELNALRLAMTTMRHEHEALSRQCDTAVAHTKELEERDKQKVVTVMRDAEVKKLRRHAQEVILTAQKLERELEYQRMDGDLKSKKIDKLAQQLSIVTQQKKASEASYTKQQKESFKSERQIGRLLKERANLRAELRQLVKDLNQGPTLKTAKPVPQRPTSSAAKRF